MRILNIAFRNLNSLAGDWSIDLRAPEFEASGIFAITGPTGAGKSTVLDAVCLALYGSTPRLGKVSKGANDIMTRGTGDCFADVTFSTLRGEFRCRWSQRRARGKADGELQPARHELFDAEGVSLADKMHDVAARVEELTGMDFERFTQSALLAQGRFATFLLAEGRDRAPLLEQLTGTEIYSRISSHIFRRAKAEQERLAALDAELASCNVLSDDEEKALRDECLRIAGEAADIDAQEKALNVQLNTLRSCSALKKEQETLGAEQTELDRQAEDFQADRSRLETARRALRFSGDCAALLARQDEQRRDKAEALRMDAELVPLAASDKECESRHQNAEQALAKAKELSAALQEMLKSVRSLDVQLAEKREELRSRETACHKARNGQEQSAALLAQHEKELAQTQPLLNEKKLWLEAHAADSALAAKLGELRLGFAQLEQQAKSLRERSLLIDEKNRILAQKEQACETLRLLSERMEQEHGRLEGQQNEHLARLSKLLEGRSATEWHQQKEELTRLCARISDMQDKVRRHGVLLSQAEQLETSLLKLRQELEQEQAAAEAEQARLDESERLRQELAENISLLERIRSYEEARLHLREGEACPLCGAVHHPFAQGSVPAVDEKKLQLDACEAKVRQISASLTQRRAAIAALERDSVHGRSSLKARQEEALALAADIMEGVAALPLMSPSLSFEDENAREALLAALAQAFTDAEKTLTKADAIIRQADGEQKTAEKLRLLLEQAREQAVQSRQQLHSSEQEHAVLQAELRGLALEQDAAMACHETTFSEQRLALAGLGCTVQALSDMPEALRSLGERRDRFQRAQEELARLTSDCADLDRLILIDRQELKNAERQLQDAMQERSELSQTLLILQEKRTALFGEKDCDREEVETASHLREAEAHCMSSLASRDEARQKHADTAARLAALEKKTGEREEQLAADSSALLSRLEEAGFSGIDVCMQACLSEEQRKVLEAQEQELIEKQASLNARLKDCARKLEELDDLPSISEEDILSGIETARSRKAALMEELGARKEKLDSNESRKKAADEALEARARQEKIYRRWADLNELIGSADGKKFRNYAQELTFRILIGHANRQLRTMTDRYQLVQDPKEALALAVIDRYQADAVRTSRNLSGGESFLVSLSLALGLARMASRTVRVDSVFLDEGFGTLDEDALNTALDMLSSLRQQGKIIGVISHVQAIRERIGTRLIIEPEGSGRSRIVGPGVSRPSHSKA